MQQHQQQQQQRDPVTGQPMEASREMIETKEFFRTSEFWVLAAGALAILITALVHDGFDATEATRFFTYLSIAYIVSRGIAKAGNAHPFRGRAWPMLNMGQRNAPYYGYAPDGYIEQMQPPQTAVATQPVAPGPPGAVAPGAVAPPPASTMRQQRHG